MKKILCLALVVLSLVFVFTGCGATGNMANGIRTYDDMSRNGNGNVSTSRDGTVNGRNRNGGFMDNAGANMRGSMRGANGSGYTTNPGTR